ncbi:MAG: hypothetical protein LBO64_02305 [Desulfovibrio sp.]|jgi:hypothetical protein|nr:hypothetical protein [Desulfovibrio sp.]
MDIYELLWRMGWLWAILLNGLFLWLNWSLSRRFVSREEWGKKVGEAEIELEKLRGQNAALRERINGISALMGKQENQLTILLRGHLEDGCNG